MPPGVGRGGAESADRAAGVPLADAIADRDAQALLRPRLMRLEKITARASDTDIALGSDVMSVALQCYGLLKVTGFAELNDTRQELGLRFAKGSRTVWPAPELHPASVASMEAKAA